MPRTPRTLLIALALLSMVGCERRSALVHATEDVDARGDDDRLPDNYVAEDPIGRPLAQAGTAASPAPEPSGPTGTATTNTANATNTTPPPTRPSSVAPTPSTSDDPHISRSPGKAGGVVILWPRVIPSSTEAENRPQAGVVQEHLRALAQRTLPGRDIDVRPEPERVCRKSGCEGVAIGAVLSRKGTGCVVLATVTAAGPVDTALVPMAGRLDLDRTSIPFREPPESHITVREFANCATLDGIMTAGDETLAGAIRRAAP